MDRQRSTAAAPPSAAGTGWSEIFMGGSPDAERALIEVETLEAFSPIVTARAAAPRSE